MGFLPPDAGDVAERQKLASLTPHFSVIIPAYNRAHTLGASIASVLRQSDQDFEIIVVDDGSKDDPAAVVQRFRDSRIKLHRQANRGAGPARNAGIDLARGSFVAFLDSDDTWLPFHLSTMRTLLTGTIRCAAYAPLLVERGLDRRIQKPPRAIRPGEQMANYLLCDRGFVSTCTLVLPAEFARRIRWRDNVRAADDADFVIRLHAAGLRFVMAPEPAAVWDDRYDPSRASASNRDELVPWLESLKGRIPHSAWLGARGWVIAKGVAQKNPLRALRYFLTAMFAGVYPVKLLPVIFLQIVLSPWHYRWLANRVISLTAPKDTPERQRKSAVLEALC